MNRSNGAELASFSVVEVAKTGEAWDIIDPNLDPSLIDSTNPQRKRLVCQLGCGCSGMKAYETSSEYSNTLTKSGTYLNK